MDLALEGLPEKAKGLLIALAQTGAGDYGMAKEYYGERALRTLTYYQPNALITFHRNPTRKYVFLAQHGKAAAKKTFLITNTKSSQYNQLDHDMRMFSVYIGKSTHVHMHFDHSTPDGSGDRIIKDCTCSITKTEQDTWNNEKAIQEKFKTRGIKDKIWSPDGEYTTPTGQLVAVEAIGHYTKFMKSEKIKFARQYYNSYVTL